MKEGEESVSALTSDLAHPSRLNIKRAVSQPQPVYQRWGGHLAITRRLGSDTSASLWALLHKQKLCAGL